MNRPLVLVVDDDPAIRETLREVLQDSGYDVAEARDGEEALAHLEGHRVPAAILLDLLLPKLDGWMFVKRLESNPNTAHVPVIVATGAAAHWGYPSPHVFTKPFDLGRLLAKIRELVPPSKD